MTGSGGLIGAEAVKYFAASGHSVFGIDNNMRKFFFGDMGDLITSEVEETTALQYWNPSRRLKQPPRGKSTGSTMIRTASAITSVTFPMTKFKTHYPTWQCRYTLSAIIEEMAETLRHV